MTVRVLLADDQALVRGGFRMILAARPDVEVVGEAADGVEALEKIRVLEPEVALIDVRMPRMDRVELVRRLAAGHPEVAPLILTTFDDDAYVFEGLRAGARGDLLKDTPSEDLVVAITKAHRGETILDASVTSKVISEFRRLSGPADDTPGTGPLSEREIEVLRLVSSGHSNRKIARTLYITEGTVKNYVTNILRKLGLRDRTQAAIYAAEHWPVEHP